ncbi:MAG: M67 family metallopeptidase [Candidatus Omnitrophota bacterium]|nr:M67 family metallopeptidase [Candidatus Omnitrophota bacterium]
MLTLKKDLLEKMFRQIKKEFPNEACGILAGKDSQVNKVYEMNNTDKSPSTYFMDANEQLKVMKEIRNLGLEMIGIYHSHVASQAYPSAHDVEMAFYPEASYVIISLVDKNKPAVRSFKINEGAITEEEVKIE